MPWGPSESDLQLQKPLLSLSVGVTAPLCPISGHLCGHHQLQCLDIVKGGEVGWEVCGGLCRASLSSSPPTGPSLVLSELTAIRGLEMLWLWGG